MNKKVVLFDIDYTLFDARMYRERFTQEIAVLLEYMGNDFYDIADEVYQQQRKEKSYFDPELFAHMLSKKLSIPIDVSSLKKIIADEKIIETALYDDSIRVLSQLSQQKDIALGIFSAGLLHVQRPKIKQLEQFLDQEHIHIYEFKKQHALPELMKQYEFDDVTMIDDMLDVLYLANQVHPSLRTIWIRRKGDVESKIDNFTPNSIIKTLEEVIPIL